MVNVANPGADTPIIANEKAHCRVSFNYRGSAMVDREIIETVRRYLEKINSNGITKAKAMLYGSAARGEMHEWSDIDIVVISPIFDGLYDREKLDDLWHATTIDSRIEPIPCGVKQWDEDDFTPIFEIARQEGILIEAA